MSIRHFFARPEIHPLIIKGGWWGWGCWHGVGAVKDLQDHQTLWVESSLSESLGWKSTIRIFELKVYRQNLWCNNGRPQPCQVGSLKKWQFENKQNWLNCYSQKSKLASLKKCTSSKFWRVTDSPLVKSVGNDVLTAGEIVTALGSLEGWTLLALVLSISPFTPRSLTFPSSFW